MAEQTFAQLSHRTDVFVNRHVGPDPASVATMLKTIGFDTIDALIEATVPAAIYRGEDKPLRLPEAESEARMLTRASELAAANPVYRTYIGAGYYPCVVPGVVRRNVLENPGWYTQYTPYQAEISQGRLEALLNFQTMVSDLTGLALSNASLLDESTAAAEAMHLCHQAGKGKRTAFLVADDCHPQTIAVVQTRAEPMGIEVRVGAVDAFEFAGDVFGALVQYPTTDGAIVDYSSLCDTAHANGSMVVVAADLLSLALLRPPGEFGADIAVGSTQRFGVPLGFGGPHAAYFATQMEHKRLLPGRLVGVSVDSNGRRALRMALQTREQHIRRARATSNICTSQVLLAVMASMYGVYHGPQGLRGIAQRIHRLTQLMAKVASEAGFKLRHQAFFDTLTLEHSAGEISALLARAESAHVEVRRLSQGAIAISLDEAVSVEDFQTLVSVVTGATAGEAAPSLDALAADLSGDSWAASHARTSDYLTHSVFNSYHSEHEMLRYLRRLESRDLSLTSSMIPLGSCTMKLNATSEMLPITLPGFSDLHPFSPPERAVGYQVLVRELEAMLGEITGLPAVSLQPNAGSQGEYSGLLAIRAFHRANGEQERTVCLIPSSAHGTNPASAVLAGMKVVVVKCDDLGNIDVADLEAKASKHREQLGALMVTYPSTHGVFEETIVAICDIVHAHGGQVYMDGANMNAQVGLCRPGEFGADVLHLNLHKTFCIPHGGGGPGVGPIAAAEHLRPHLPGHPLVEGLGGAGAVSAAPWGSAGILPISWMYIRMMGPAGLRKASQVAILNANYLAARLRGPFDILYTGVNGTVAHEFIIDLRPLKKGSGVGVADVAKRLMDYGFHSPTMSWPVAGTLMVEPTESETLQELDRFADAMLAIRAEIEAIASGDMPYEDSPLHHAPHTAEVVTGDTWERPYTRSQAAYPLGYLREHKFWPRVGRVDDAYGDRNLVCTCLPIEAYTDEA